jgi:hypothetical protein
MAEFVSARGTTQRPESAKKYQQPPCSPGHLITNPRNRLRVASQAQKPFGFLPWSAVRLRATPGFSCTTLASQARSRLRVVGTNDHWKKCPQANRIEKIDSAS